MKTKFPLIIFGMYFLALTISLSGCAANTPQGPVFSMPASPQPGKALIYIYRPPSEKMGGGLTYFLQANSQRLRDLRHGGYYPYETNPGHVQFLSNVDTNSEMKFPLDISIVGNALENAGSKLAKLDFDVEAGRVYYVKMHPETYFTHYQPQLFLMTNSDGESEIKVCKLITE